MRRNTGRIFTCTAILLAFHGVRAMAVPTTWIDQTAKIKWLFLGEVKNAEIGTTCAAQGREWILAQRDQKTLESLHRAMTISPIATEVPWEPLPPYRVKAAALGASNEYYEIQERMRAAELTYKLCAKVIRLPGEGGGSDYGGGPVPSIAPGFREYCQKNADKIASDASAKYNEWHSFMFVSANPGEEAKSTWQSTYPMAASPVGSFNVFCMSYDIK